MENSTKQEIVAGATAMTPVAVAVVFFGMMFGATGASSGLPYWQTILTSAVTVAGASQFVFLELYNQGTPVWSVLLAVFAVNFRHILYSASISRYLGEFSFRQKLAGFFVLTDLTYAASEYRANKVKLTPVFYFSYGLVQYFYWMISTAVGGLLGNLISNPQAIGMDMLLPIYFLLLLMGFRAKPNWLTCVIVSGLVSVLVYQTVGAPWHIMSGAISGVVAAALIGKPTDKKERANA